MLAARSDPEPLEPQNFHSSRAGRLQRWINSSSSNASISPASSRAKPSRARSSNALSCCSLL
jgi:hypothetical protein